MPTAFEPPKRFEQTIQKPFLKTKFGIVLIFILALVGITVLAFTGLTGYYLYKIQTGHGDTIKEQFTRQNNEQFTSANTKNRQTNISAKEIEQTIRTQNAVLGPSDASITIIEFIDFECPFSQKSYPIFKKIVNQYNGAVRVVFKHFPVQELHPFAIGSGIAASCAQDQNKFWEYHDKLFDTKKLDPDSLRKYAQELGLDMQLFDSCALSQKKLFQVNQDIQDGLTLGVRGTPTYFINDIKIEGVLTEKEWTAVLLDQIK